MNRTTEDEERLSAYIDGELTPAERLEVEKRLAECAEYRAQYETLAKVADMITAGLRAARCLSPADKAAYLHGQLSDERRSEIDEHLARCRNCREELDELRRWADEPAEATASEAQSTLQPPTRSRFSRWVGVFIPLAAAAAIVIGVTTMLLEPSEPAITSISLQAAAVRSPEDTAGRDIAFGSAYPLHTNDRIQFRLDPGRFRYATVFWMYPDGSVHEQTAGPLDDPKYLEPTVRRHGAVHTPGATVVLPAPDSRWPLPAYVGTDVMFFVLTKEPLPADVVARAKQALSTSGPPPELPYGSILWLGRDNRWTGKAPSRLNTISTALRRAVGGRNSALRGVAFAHE